MNRSLDFLLVGVAAGFLLVAGCDDSTVPLTAPSQASPDERLIGVWRHAYDGGTTYYLVGRLGGKAPESVMRVVSVTQPKGGELHQPHQMLLFPSRIGGESYLNLAGVSEEQLASIRESGWRSGMLGSYILLKYEVRDDAVMVWATDPESKRKAIEAGKIQGEIQEGDNGGKRIRFTDTTEKLAAFVAAEGETLFAKTPLRFDRMN